MGEAIMSVVGQNAKNSERANDFRFAPNIRHWSAAQFSGENHLRLNSFPPDAQQRLTILPRTGPAAPTLRRLRTTPYGPRVATNNLPVRFIGTHAQTAIVAVCSRSRP